MVCKIENYTIERIDYKSENLEQMKKATNFDTSVETLFIRHSTLRNYNSAGEINETQSYMESLKIITASHKCYLLSKREGRGINRTLLFYSWLH